jgi:membrane fusion protein, heavy metal efflux system
VFTVSEEAVPFSRRPRRTAALIALGSAVFLVGAASWSLIASRAKESDGGRPNTVSSVKNPPGVFSPTPAQWATLTVEPVKQLVFRPEHVTEGKIAVDEDRSTLIFSPFAGRVTKLLVKPGDSVERGQPLFTIEAADAVQAQNDFMAALAGVNKARSQVSLTRTIEQRLHTLYEGKATSLREWQQAQVDLTAAENDFRTAETALEATRNRLRILGKTEEEISNFQKTGTISREAPVFAPLAGTIVQRKVGPGQYLTAGASDPVFVIGDLSTVWLVAYVRETEAPNVQVGQAVQFTVLAYRDQVFPANVNYVATSLDPGSRRLLVRATINNAQHKLKPEMFASVSISTGEGDAALAVPRNAIIYEGDSARVWIARDDKSIELRQIKPGLASDGMIQVLEGLKSGDRVITKGALFIDRAASSGSG